MERLAQLPWELDSAPWIAVYSADGQKMLTGKDNTDLLAELLHVHLAPSSGQAIKRARKNFKDTRSMVYPVTEDELAKRLPSVDAPAPDVEVVLPPEISPNAESDVHAPEEE